MQRTQLELLDGNLPAAFTSSRPLDVCVERARAWGLHEAQTREIQTRHHICLPNISVSLCIPVPL